MKVFHGDEVSFRCFPKFLPKILSNFHLSLCKSLVCCFPPSFEPLWNPLFVFVVVCVWKYCGFSLGPCPFLSLCQNGARDVLLKEQHCRDNVRWAESPFPWKGDFVKSQVTAAAAPKADGVSYFKQFIYGIIHWRNVLKWCTFLNNLPWDSPWNSGLPLEYVWVVPLLMYYS